MTWTKASIKDAIKFFNQNPYIITLSCSVTDEVVKIDKSILSLIENEGFNHATPLYSKTLINFYRILTIAVMDIIFEEEEFKPYLKSDELKFLRHIRNTSAHGNKFYWGKGRQRKKTLKSFPIQWRGKIIEESLENKSLYMDFMVPGDIFILLSDINSLVKK